MDTICCCSRLNDMTTRLRAVAAAAILLGAAGCGTVTHGRYQTIEVTSNPPGANVSLRCGERQQGPVVTPASLKVSRRALPCEIAVAHPGGAIEIAPLTRHVSRAFWRNLFWVPATGAAGLLSGSGNCSGFGICFSGERLALGGLLFGLLPAAIGMVVDVATGAMYEQKPARVDAGVDSAGSGAGATSTARP